MAAIRVARGFTGKQDIVKVEGGFHGAHDAVLIQAGSGATTHGIPDSAGVLPEVAAHTRQVPFNDVEALDSMFSANPDIAAFILEPVMGNIGPILPEKGFLHEVRRLTKDHDVLLIFDEVITGFRLARGGGQEYYGVIPDVSTFGKVAGGGLPFGAVGGTVEAMHLMEFDTEPGAILMAGTFNGNPLVTASGTAVLQRLNSEPGLYTRLNAMGDRFRDEINQFALAEGYPAVATGVGSMFWMHATPGPIHSIRDVRGGHRYASPGLRLLYRLNGLHIPTYHGFMCTAHTDEDITYLIETHKAAMHELRVHGVW